MKLPPPTSSTNSSMSPEAEYSIAWVSLLGHSLANVSVDPDVEN